MSQNAAAVFEWLDAVSNAIFVLRDDQILWANSAAGLLTGYSSPDLQDLYFTHLFADLRNHASNKLFIHADGSPVKVQVAFKAAELNGESVIVATVSSPTSAEKNAEATQLS